MNILPKKRWHVRTKDNIARVRRDEAAAQEEEQKRKQKLELAESEARINFLRRQSGLPEKHSTNEVTASTSSTANTDLFADYKTHIKQTNKDLEKEKKDEKEKYEKQIGYLTYLGQDTNEALKLHSWYEVAPKRMKVGDLIDDEKDLKTKTAHDPLTLIKAILPPEKKFTHTIRKTNSIEPDCSTSKKSELLCINDLEKKHEKKKKKHKKKKNHKRDRSNEKEIERIKLERLSALRKERIKREASEKARQDALFAPKDVPVSRGTSVANTPRIVQKYNSQFNPEIAKQNML